MLSGLRDDNIAQGGENVNSEAQADVRVIPHYSVDDLGQPNGGLTDGQMRLAQQIFDSSQRAGVDVQEFTGSILETADAIYENAVQSAEQYIRDYRPQGVAIIRTPEGGGYRASQNEGWYSDFYREKGHAPRAADIPALAARLVDGDMRRGGGQFAAPQAAQYYRQAENIRAAVETLGNGATGLQAGPDGLTVTYGATPESSVGAAQGGFDPYSRMVNEYGAIPPGENPARVVDVPQSTNGTDRVSRHARTVMEATVTRDEVTELLEREVAAGRLSHEIVRDNDAIQSAAERLSNTRDIRAETEQFRRFAEGLQEPNKQDIAYGQAIYAYLNQIGDTQGAADMASSLIAISSRAGQNLQASRMLKKLSPEGRLMTAVKMRDRLQNDLNQKYGDKAPQLELNEELTQNLQLADGDAAQKSLNELMIDIANQMPSTWQDKWDALRFTSMLSSPRTHIRNILGNAIFGEVVGAKNKVGAVIESGVDAASRSMGKGGIERSKTLLTNKVDRDFAALEWENVVRQMEQSKYDNITPDNIRQLKTNVFSGGLLEKAGVGRFNLANFLNLANNLNSAALEKEDMFAKKRNFVSSMAQYMKANGLTAADMYNDLGGETDALLAARDYAMLEANRATFNDQNNLSDKLGELERALPTPAQMVVEGLIPFKRTPLNIIKRGVSYSPAGLAKGLTYDLMEVKRGNKTAAQAIDQIAAGATGTALTALGYMLSEKGWVSGGDDDNDKKQYFDETQGKQSYALNLPGGTYTIDWTAPASLPFFVGVELEKAFRNTGTTFEDFTGALSRITEPVFDLTMMQGINDALQSASYGTGAQMTALASSAVTDYFTQVAPTLLGQINRSFFDKTRRQTYPDKDNNIPDGIEKVMQRNMQKIPFLSQKLPAYTDVWGREQQNAGALENFFSPGYYAKRNTSDAEAAIDALYQATGDAEILPSKPPKSYTVDGEKKNLSASQWLQLTNTKGQTSLSAIDGLTKTAVYQRMSDEERAETIKDIYKYAGNIAANRIYGKELEGTAKAIQESGIEPGVYFAYKEIEDSLNESMESVEARDEVFRTIREDASLSAEQKDKLYEAVIIKGVSDSQLEKYQAISDKVTPAEYADAMIQSQAIKNAGDELEEGRATAEATEFSYYLDAMGYEGDKRATLEDTFKFFQMFPAQPENYTFDMIRENGGTKEKAAIDEVESVGLTASQYAAVKNATRDVTYEKGKTGAKLAAVAEAVSKNVDTYDQYAAVMHALGYKKIDGYYTSGGTLPEDTEWRGLDVGRSSDASGEETGINPLPEGTEAWLSNGYGYREQPTEGASTFHQGNDIAAPMGTPVGAYRSGTVAYTGWDSSGGGNIVIIDHPDGTQSLYMHLKDGSFAVKPGDQVAQGQQIAAVGSTGISTGPHLHFSVKVNGEYVDPAGYYPGY